MTKREFRMVTHLNTNCPRLSLPFEFSTSRESPPRYCRRLEVATIYCVFLTPSGCLSSSNSTSRTLKVMPVAVDFYDDEEITRSIKTRRRESQKSKMKISKQKTLISSGPKQIAAHIRLEISSAGSYPSLEFVH